MKKQSIIIIICACVIVFAVVGVLAIKNSKKSSQIKFENSEEILKMFDSIYANLKDELPSLQTAELDATDALTVSAYTGLKSNENVESLVVSEPLMNAQAYSVVVVKVKDGADMESMKKEMLDNINMRKWICVSADKLYITSTGNVIFIVMSSEDWAKPVYEEFKKYVNNNVNKELERTEVFG